MSITLSAVKPTNGQNDNRAIQKVMFNTQEIKQVFFNETKVYQAYKRTTRTSYNNISGSLKYTVKQYVEETSNGSKNSPATVYWTTPYSIITLKDITQSNSSTNNTVFKFYGYANNQLTGQIFVNGSTGKAYKDTSFTTKLPSDGIDIAGSGFTNNRGYVDIPSQYVKWNYSLLKGSGTYSNNNGTYWNSWGTPENPKNWTSDSLTWVDPVPYIVNEWNEDN